MKRKEEGERMNENKTEEESKDKKNGRKMNEECHAKRRRQIFTK